MEDVIFNQWQNAIADSAVLGNQDVRNMDLTLEPGVLRANYALAKESSTTITGLITWMVADPATQKVFAVDNAGKVYKKTSGTWSVIEGNTTTSAHGNGLVVWKGYLFVFRDALIDVMKISDESWTNGWKAITSDGLYHPAVVGQDDTVYFGAGRYVGSLLEAVGQTFVPGTAETFTFNDLALTLPSGYRVKTLAELGKNLMVGTWMGTNVYDIKVADIFPWDRTSSSFSLPIRINDFGVHQMVNINNILYIHAGITGQWYVSNGTVTQKFRRLPRVMTGVLGGNFINALPGAVCQHKGKIFFGISRGTGSAAIDGFGVWSLTEEGVLTFEHQISTDTTTGANAISMGALLSTGAEAFVVSWQDNATYGVDSPSANAYTTQKASFTTDLKRVGSKMAKRKFTQCEVSFAQPLASGQSVRIKYRKDLNTAFTTLYTVDYSTEGAVQTWTIPFSGDSLEFIQLKIEFAGTTSPRLLDVRLR